MDSITQQRATQLRHTGQYEAALSILSNVVNLNDHILSERAICHFMRHEFEEVARIHAQLVSQETSKGSIEEAIILTLYNLSCVHTNLALQEAVQTAQGTYTTWLAHKPPESFKDKDLPLLCYCHITLALGCRFLCDSTQQWGRQAAEMPSCSLLDALRARFLHERQLGSLAIIHLAEAVSEPPSRKITKIRQTLELVPEDNNDLHLHLVVLLARASYERGNYEHVVQEMARIRSSFSPNNNTEAQWWSEYYLLKASKNEEVALEDVERLLRTSVGHGARDAALVGGFLEAQFHLDTGDEERYSERIRDLLEQSHQQNLPINEESGKTSEQERPQSALRPSVSPFEFWLQYLDLIKDDMNSRTRLGLALFCLTRFFERYSRCSIPELKFVLATSLAECYEACGDIHAALHWTAQEKVFAEEADDQSLKDEAKFNMCFLMADDSIKVGADPDGLQLAGWRAAQRLDLEIMYEEAREKGLIESQVRCASLRLDKELEDEVAMGLGPQGSIWLEKTLEAIDHLQEPERSAQRQQIKYKIAHSKFDFGDWNGAADALGDVLEMLETEDNHHHLLSQCFFTKARAHLHEYMSSKSSRSWELCLDALDKSLAGTLEQKNIDEAACCQTLAAVAWRIKGSEDKSALATALYHISEARKLWEEESKGIIWPSLLRLDDLLLKYSLRGRNESNPYGVLGLAIEICFESGRFDKAWEWIEYGKARVFAEDLGSRGTDSDPLTPEEILEPPDLGESAVIVHWTFVGDTVYMTICRQRTQFRMVKLDIAVSAVEEWYQNLVATKEDFGSVETSEELLSELAELCAPIFDPDISNPEDLLVFSPTGILFRIPLHAIIVEGVTVLERNPVAYTYSAGVLHRCLRRAIKLSESGRSEFAFLGNPTGDTPAGERSVKELVARLGGKCYTRDEASKAQFCSSASKSRLVHFHGHVNAGYHPQQNAMLFSNGHRLRARDVFGMDYRQLQPAVVLIGCGSGTERLNTGDEPAGLISAFLHAGASAVIATLWPINDSLSGAAFSDVLYEVKRSEDSGLVETLDLARQLRKAALKIKGNEHTAAPYFWAGFVLYGKWILELE
ncbi:Separin [Podospora fimiseda]|uniref:Separin n=1 Tax=Podospora fimiseda TaxID=252190 RepID=A0AAN7C138_9PEZI|nr:Separin [Podospora fimiseda]